MLDEVHLNQKERTKKGHVRKTKFLRSYTIHTFYIYIRGKIDSFNDLAKLVEILVLEEV